MVFAWIGGAMKSLKFAKCGVQIQPAAGSFRAGCVEFNSSTENPTLR